MRGERSWGQAHISWFLTLSASNASAACRDRSHDKIILLPSCMYVDLIYDFFFWSSINEIHAKIIQPFAPISPGGLDNEVVLKEETQSFERTDLKFKTLDFSFLYSLFLFSQIFFSDNCKERETYFRNSLYCLSGLFSGLSSGTRSLQHGLISLLLENKVLLLPKVKVSNFSRDYIASRS